MSLVGRTAPPVGLYSCSFVVPLRLLRVAFIGSVTLSAIIFAALFTSPNISTKKAGSSFSLVSQCFRIGGVVLLRYPRCVAEERTAKGCGKFRHKFLTGVERIPEEAAERAVQPLGASRAVRHLVQGVP